jgi:Protein of unknown function (DUF1091)
MLPQVDMTIERISYSNKTPNAVVDFKDLTLKKFNRTHKAFNGQFTLLKDLGNDFEVRMRLKNHHNWRSKDFFLQLGVEIYKMEGNEYRKTPFKLPYEKLCNLLAKETYFYPSVVAASNLPPQDTCPVPAGTYTVENYFMDISQVPPNFDGRFRVRIMERHMGELIDEFNSFAEMRHYLT